MFETDVRWDLEFRFGVPPSPQEMHTHDFPLEKAEEVILTLAGRCDGPASIHSCLRPAL